jgi:hypothetical protein
LLYRFLKSKKPQGDPDDAMPAYSRKERIGMAKRNLLGILEQIIPLILHVARGTPCASDRFVLDELEFIAEVPFLLVLHEFHRTAHALPVNSRIIKPAIQAAMQVRPAFHARLVAARLGSGETLPTFAAGVAFFHG